MSDVNDIKITIKPGLTVDESSISVAGQKIVSLDQNAAASWGLGFASLQGIFAEWMRKMGTGLIPREITYDGFGRGELTDFSSIITPTNQWWEPDSDSRFPDAKSVPTLRLTVMPIGARITGIDTEPTIIDRQILDNRESKEAVTYRPHISDTVVESVETNWQVSHSLGVSLTVGLEVGSEAAGMKSKVESTISYDTSWGHGGSQSKSTEVGSGIELDVTLQPGDLAVAALSGYSGTLKAEIDLVASLDGFVGANTWSKGHHHFWPGPMSGDRQPQMTWFFMDITALLKYLGKQSLLIQDAKQFVNDRFFADGKSGVYPVKDTAPDDIDSAVFGPKGHALSDAWEVYDG